MTATSLMTENPLFKSIGQIFHPLFVAVADTLAFIYGLIPNYAIAIILLTILIMLLLTPLTVKSTRSMIAMQSLQPEMQKLRAKYKGAENREVLNQELMKLYKEHGVNPMGGCLPMFLQMPFLIVLYDVIRGLSNTTKTKNVVTTCAQYLSGSTHFLTNAQPRYIPNTSKMYCNLVQSGGAMKAFGMNLALVAKCQLPSITASASSRTFSSTPLLLRAGSGVQGGPTVFVGPFIARPLTLRTARYHGVWTKRSFVLTRDSFAASDQDSSL